MKSEIGGKVNGNRLNIDCVLKDVDYYVLAVVFLLSFGCVTHLYALSFAQQSSERRIV